MTSLALGRTILAFPGGVIAICPDLGTISSKPRPRPELKVGDSGRRATSPNIRADEAGLADGWLAVSDSLRNWLTSGSEAQLDRK